MRILSVIIILFSISLSFGQKIGEMAPEKQPETFPPNSWGVDIMFGEGGLGLGTFFRYSFSNTLTGFTDFSISESKDDKEVEYIDYFGRTYTIGKQNRVFLLPLYFGLQYRLFAESLTDNLRPYINFGAGPTFVVTTPYEKEFFNSFGSAKMHYAVGGYVGFGANIGISKSNLVGLNLRYYYINLFGDGVENMTDRFRKRIGSFYLTINLGIMY